MWVSSGVYTPGIIMMEVDGTTGAMVFGWHRGCEGRGPASTRFHLHHQWMIPVYFPNAENVPPKLAPTSRHTQTQPHLLAKYVRFARVDCYTPNQSPELRGCRSKLTEQHALRAHTGAPPPTSLTRRKRPREAYGALVRNRFRRMKLEILSVIFGFAGDLLFGDIRFSS